MKSIPSTRASDGYKIIVRGQLSEEWLQEFQGLRLSSDGEFTTLTAGALDQTALRGLLCCLWDLNLVLISVDRVADIYNV